MDASLGNSILAYLFIRRNEEEIKKVEEAGGIELLMTIIHKGVYKPAEDQDILLSAVGKMS